MILFIHGLGSCGWGTKSLLLRRHFGIARVLAPDLPFEPHRALAQLRDLVDRYRVEALVGSSLGGFYATCLNAGPHPLPAILINPVVAPHLRLAGFRGQQRRWCDDAPFSVSDDVIAALAGLYRERLRRREPYLVLLQQGDEVLDYRDAAVYYAGKAVVTSPGGNHRYDNLADHLPQIDAWLDRHGVHPPAGRRIIPVTTTARRTAGPARSAR